MWLAQRSRRPHQLPQKEDWRRGRSPNPRRIARRARPLPADRLLFLTHTGDRPYKATTFGNWFHDQCIAAALPHCSSHGLRKAGATRLANAGATEMEIMAFLGHRTPDEA